MENTETNILLEEHWLLNKIDETERVLRKLKFRLSAARFLTEEIDALPENDATEALIKHLYQCYYFTPRNISLEEDLNPRPDSEYRERVKEIVKHHLESNKGAK